MTRSDLIAAMAKRFPQLSTEDVRTSVDILLDGLTQSLLEQVRVEIRGFGTLTSHVRPSRTGRNPRTGEKVTVPAKRVAHFKSSKDLMQRLHTAFVAAHSPPSVMQAPGKAGAAPGPTSSSPSHAKACALNQDDGRQSTRR
ncbi:MAG: HU family DNA-binding protein [Burkholderiaceae bacterium]